ncbi:NDP-hexose 2,3-dehydratase [Nonomuraea sp. NN258]|uniref:NDP-hexose 2,3-dehydratase family protein n=1 Tax=Nonomuraea antri TaxID=2730852 RepID=UPI001568C583|nr:NDP-hexose 2,3-dehydratase family protein [Nonomuraea antri]NRQ31681.1 NDP-hexose 2,3-dehydratase [Nonomuraea antri]
MSKLSDTLTRENDGYRTLLTRSALAGENSLLSTQEILEWFESRRRADRGEVRRISLDDLDGWCFAEETGNLQHRSGRFFSIEGLRVTDLVDPAGGWTQPIINQPEVGILGFLAKELGGVIHVLVQAKMEPGNVNGLQLSPTVQATHSNHTGVHKGAAVPYLEHFLSPRRGSVLVDVLQSEHGGWFLGKRNRNMVVRVDDEVPVLDGFCWMTLGQLQELLHRDNLINMDSRTVLSCIPFAQPTPDLVSDAPDGFRGAVLRSAAQDGPALHTMTEIMSWLTEARSRRVIVRRVMNLADVAGWKRAGGQIAHEAGRYFRVVGVSVHSDGREVRQWTQPLFEPTEQGVVALIAKRVDGVLHVLVQARQEAGLLDVVELAATVQATPGNYDQPPPYLREVLDADPSRIRYDTLLSEEGGRFLHAVSRYLLVEAGDDFPLATPPEFRWVTLGQLTELVRHSCYVNVQARTLLACLHGLWGAVR